LAAFLLSPAHAAGHPTKLVNRILAGRSKKSRPQTVLRGLASHDGNCSKTIQGCRAIAGNESKIVHPHIPVNQPGEGERSYEQGSSFGKRTPISCDRLVVSTNRSFPARSKLVFAGAGQRMGVSGVGGVGELL
jgi:hypothetical protein